MNYIGNSRKEKRRKKNRVLQCAVIILAIGASIYLLAQMNLPILSNISGAVVSGLNTVVSTVKGVITSGKDYFSDIQKLNEENTALKEELEKTKLELLEMQKIEVENEDLRAALKMEEKYNHFSKIYANVILRDYSNWNETFVIDKGSNDGIKEKQTVISPDGLVGYVSQVATTTSVVTTILNPNTSVSVEVSTVNALALAKGDFDLKENSQMKLTNLPITTELSVGEKVYTSGIGTMYEKGLVIGEIKEVVNSKNNIDRYAIITPYTDFDSLDFVAVILK